MTSKCHRSIDKIDSDVAAEESLRTTNTHKWERICTHAVVF